MPEKTRFLNRDQGRKRVRVLITGGAGFIGSNLARTLVDQGHDVVIVDNLSMHHSTVLLGTTLARVQFFHCDIRVPEDFEALPAGPYDRIYHLAASFANARSLAQPALDVQTNALGTLNTLSFAKRVGCGLFVYTGSSSSYGPAPIPFREDGPLFPSTPYATTKRLGEQYVEASGLSAAIFRLFNVYGPGDPPGIYRNAIPNMIAALDRPEATIDVLGDGATRDFTYVDDVVEVLIEAQRAAGKTLNIGTGKEVSIAALARQIVLLFGLNESHLRFKTARNWDTVIRRVADTSALQACFPGSCSTNIDDALSRTATWLHQAGFVLRRPL